MKRTSVHKLHEHRDLTPEREVQILAEMKRLNRIMAGNYILEVRQDASVKFNKLNEELEFGLARRKSLEIVYEKKEKE